MAEPRRDEFPNNFVGDLVRTERGRTVVPPTCCPAGHDYARPGLVGQLGLVQLQRRHMAWRCWRGAGLYAPQPGPHCRIRDNGPVSMWEDEQRRPPYADK